MFEYSITPIFWGKDREKENNYQEKATKMLLVRIKMVTD